MEYYDRVVELDGDMFRARYNRGLLNASMGNTPGACADLRKAEKLRPSYPGITSKRESFCQGRTLHR